MSLTIINPGRIGRAVLGITNYWKDFSELILYTLRRVGALATPPVWLVLQKQIYFTGVEALGAVTAIATLSGIVITTQVTSLAGQNIVLTAKIMLWAVVRELGPLLSAIVIIARSSSARASELASMQICGEINHLRLMGIAPGDYLVVPRIVGITLSVVAVTFYFQMTAILTGYAFAAMLGYMPFIKKRVVNRADKLLAALPATQQKLDAALTSATKNFQNLEKVTASDLPDLMRRGRETMRAAMTEIKKLTP